MHVRALNALTALNWRDQPWAPPAPGMGALGPCPALLGCTSSPAVPVHLGSDPRADLNFCLALNLSHPCELVCPTELHQLPTLASPARGLWGESLPCWPSMLPSCPSLLPDSKEKHSKFPFQTQTGATDLYLTYKLVFPYCRGFECFRLDMDKRNETKLKLNIHL